MKNDEFFEEFIKGFAGRTIGQIKTTLENAKPETSDQRLFRDLMVAGLDKALQEIGRRGKNDTGAEPKPKRKSTVRGKSVRPKSVKK